jgi:hypothetical protein
LISLFLGVFLNTLREDHHLKTKLLSFLITLAVLILSYLKSERGFFENTLQKVDLKILLTKFLHVL